MFILYIAAFFSTFFVTPYIIRYFKFVGIVTTDVHKKGKPLVPHSAGVPLVIGIMSGLFLYIFLKVFLLKDVSNLINIFATASSILIIMFVGFIDDINTKQMRIKGYIEGKKGLKAWQKPLLTIPAAIPLMVIMAGDTTMSLPFIGTVNFGILYPLLIVPIGVVGASNMVNMLGGFNGLEAGMGLVYTTALGIFAYLHGEIVAAIIFLVTSAAVLAILKYNFYPAKILPGDSLTYTLGAVVACGAIIGNMEKVTLITMTPFLIQGVLKFYSKFSLGYFASDLGILKRNGTTKSKYHRIYSWTHVAMMLNLREPQIVVFMMIVQCIFAIIPFIFWI